MSTTNSKFAKKQNVFNGGPLGLGAWFVAALFACEVAAQIPANPLDVGSPVRANVPAAAPASAPVAPPMPSPAVVPVRSAIVPPLNTAAAMEIQKINENMAVLQAQLNQLELQVKVAGKKRDLSGMSGNTALSSFDSTKGNPAVVSVAGLKGQLEAVLVLPGGSTQRVKEGDIIDDRRVVKVATNEVILADLKGKNTQRLSFGTSAVIRETLNQTGPGYGGSTIPPMPPMR